jgi:hypothetical protein
MKKILLIGFLAGALHAADYDLYNNSVLVNIGYGYNGSEPSASYAGSVYGLAFNRNLGVAEGVWKIDALQFAIEYANLNTLQRDHAFRVGANALWYNDNMSDWTPFFKLGLGMQFVSGTESMAAGNYFYGTAGAGMEYQLRGDTAIVGELVDHITFAGENNMRLSVGLKYSFGQDY